MRNKAAYRFLTLFFGLFLIQATSQAEIMVPDSIGTEVYQGKLIILHKVEPKQTLYAISKKYGVAISAITAMNPGSEAGLRVGQVIKVPTEKSAANANKNTTNTLMPTVKEETMTTSSSTTTTSSHTVKYHTVKPGETLYGISRMYPCSVEDIKKWNGLTSNALSVGQMLQVSDKKEETAPTTTSTTSTPVTTTEEEVIKETTTTTEEVVEETVEETTTTTSTETIEETVEEPTETVTTVTEEIKEEATETVEEITEEVVEETTTTEVTPIETSTEESTTQEIVQEDDDPIPSTRKVEMGGYTKIFEKGYAELIPNTQNDERYLAHHRTLPEGTILQVKNLANGKSVFVRVVDTFESDDKTLIIKLSAKAELRLQSEGPRFLTEISYIP